MIWITTAPIAAYVAPFEDPMSELEYSTDVPDQFLVALLEDCRALACDARHFLGCWLSESDLRPTARNPGALAVGFFQAMPKTLRGLGFRGDVKYLEAPGAYAHASTALATAKATNNLQAQAVVRQELRQLDEWLTAAFARLTLLEQLTWAYRYYAPHSGKLVNPGACYAANFVPAWIDHAATPAWVICARDGRSDGGLPNEESEEWFRQNEALDEDRDGAVTMGDLSARAERHAGNPRGRELVARLEQLAGARFPMPPPAPIAPLLEVALSGAPDVPEG